MDNGQLLIFRDLGKIRYREAWDYQEQRFQEVLNGKLEPQLAGYLLFCEHYPVYTLGKSGQYENLLISEEMLAKRGIDFFRINRGGDITYHGPGQIVGYPIINLEKFKMGVRQYVHSLEEAVIRTLKHYGITSERLEGATGVWIDTGIQGRARKICAIGVRVSRQVTMHGFAFNVNTNLDYFHLINPCGFTDKGVTSMAVELENEIDMEEVKNILKQNLFHILGAREQKQTI